MVRRVSASQQMELALEIVQLPVQELALRLAEELESNPLLVPEDEALLIEEEQNSGDLTEESLVADSLNPEPEEDVVETLGLRFDDENYMALHSVDPDLDELFTLDDTATRRQPFLEDRLPSTPSLVEVMRERADVHFTEEIDRAMAETLVGELDESGLIATPLGEIAESKGWDPQRLESVLHELQKIGPSGVCARTPQEHLLLQVEDEGVDLHSPAPQPEFAPTVIPDIEVSDHDSYLIAAVVTDPLPSPRFDPRYLAMMEQGAPETASYLNGWLQQGKWLLICVEQRNRLLKRIGDLLVEQMPHYLRGETTHLLPIPIHSAAHELHVQEATLVRAIANKTLSCPGGTIPLSQLFTQTYTSKR